MLGYPPDYFVGRHLWDLGFLKDSSLTKNAFAKLKTDGYIRYEDLPLETRQGKAINGEFVCNAYFVDDKKVIQCNIRDITGRRKAEEELKRKNEDLHELNEELTAAQEELRQNIEELTLKGKGAPGDQPAAPACAGCRPLGLVALRSGDPDRLVG